MPERFTVIGDLYNRIFAVQNSNPDILVDYEVWNAIFKSLPRNYTLPDLQVIGGLGTAKKGGNK